MGDSVYRANLRFMFLKVSLVISKLKDKIPELSQVPSHEASLRVAVLGTSR